MATSDSEILRIYTLYPIYNSHMYPVAAGERSRVFVVMQHIAALKCHEQAVLLPVAYFLITSAGSAS